jgi:hypothetical protein
VDFETQAWVVQGYEQYVGSRTDLRWENQRFNGFRAHPSDSLIAWYAAFENEFGFMRFPHTVEIESHAKYTFLTVQRNRYIKQHNLYRKLRNRYIKQVVCVPYTVVHIRSQYRERTCYPEEVRVLGVISTN